MSKFIFKIDNSGNLTNLTQDGNNLYQGMAGIADYSVKVEREAVFPTDTVLIVFKRPDGKTAPMSLRYEGGGTWRGTSRGWETDVSFQAASADVFVSFEVRRYSSVDNDKYVQILKTGQSVIKIYPSSDYVPLGIADPLADSILERLSDLESDNVDIFAELDGKQETLVSGVNIKTVNHDTILGGGNITIASGEGGEPINIIDGLNSTNPDAALSANSGRVLDEKKIDKTAIADDLVTNDSTKVLSAAKGKALFDTKQPNLIAGNGIDVSGANISTKGVDVWEDISDKIVTNINAFTSNNSEVWMKSEYVANRTIRLTYTNLRIKYTGERTTLVNYVVTEHQMVIKFRDTAVEGGGPITPRFEMVFVSDQNNSGSGRLSYLGTGECSYYVGSPQQHRFIISFGYAIPYPQILENNDTPRVIKIERLIENE